MTFLKISIGINELQVITIYPWSLFFFLNVAAKKGVRYFDHGFVISYAWLSDYWYITSLYL